MACGLGFFLNILRPWLSDEQILGVGAWGKPNQDKCPPVAVPQKYPQYLGLVLQVKGHGCGHLPSFIPYLRGDDGRPHLGAQESVGRKRAFQGADRLWRRGHARLKPSHLGPCGDDSLCVQRNFKKGPVLEIRAPGFSLALETCW